MKTCRKCNIEKENNEFYGNKNDCRVCEKKRRDLNQENTEESVEKSIEYYKTKIIKQKIKRSFALYPLSECILDDDCKNISYGSEEFHWFECKKCLHKFHACIVNITCNEKLSYCPYCCHNGKLCSDIECKFCEDKSFKSNLKSQYLLNHNPRFITKNSHNVGLFICGKCEHTFESTFSSISRGSWCAYCCSSGKKLCFDLECKHCENRSFKSNLKSQYLLNHNPRFIFKSADFYGIFFCNRCEYTFESTFSHVTSGRWCPFCNYKTQTKVYDYLNQIHKVEREKIFEWLERKRYDFYLPDFNLIIEVDGRQHYEPVDFFNRDRSFEEIQAIDELKNMKAKDNGLYIMRLNQEDVFNDVIDWKEIIRTKITNIIKEKYITWKLIF